MKEYIDQLVEEDRVVKNRSSEIQKKFNFDIPNYVLSEWVYAEKHNNSFNNVIALLYLAKANNRISEENVNKLKNYIEENCV